MHSLCNLDSLSQKHVIYDVLTPKLPSLENHVTASRLITPHTPLEVRLRFVFFSAPMLTDQSFHTAHGCGPAVRSRSGVIESIFSVLHALN